MVKTDPYTFADGRIGTKNYSDKVYKVLYKTDENGEEILDANGNKIIEGVMKYCIRKVGTNEIYDEAIDVLNYTYEELTAEEMAELISTGG